MMHGQKNIKLLYPVVYSSHPLSLQFYKFF